MGNDKRAAQSNRDKTVVYQYLDYRGVSKNVMEFAGYRTAIDEDTNEPAWVCFKHPTGKTLNKEIPEKKFWWEGEATSSDKSLFLQDKFPKGSSKYITVCEGALDAISVLEMQGTEYAAVAVTSASSAVSDCTKALDYLNSFERIYLAFDNDEAGREATKKVALLFDFNKVYHVPLDKKDVNEYCMAQAYNEFRKLWWASKRFVPEGILSTYTDFDEVFDNDVDKPAIKYPWEVLQNMTYGIRTGEVVLITAQEGIGKTEIVRAIEYDILKNHPDENIGVMHLEENKARTLKGYVGYELEKPVHLPDTDVTKDELKAVLRNVVGRDDRLHIYSHFGSDDPDTILNTIRFMVASCGCKRVFLDHITMVVTGLQGEDERTALDYISTRAAMMTQELDFTLFMISHVNDEGKTRGSRNISKIADLRIDISRDLECADPVLRNCTKLMVSKNRFAGRTGLGGWLWFNPDTYTLSETTDPLDLSAKELPF